MNMNRVRYECTTPPHNKWWEIEYNEDMLGYTTWWGKIGSAAQGSTPKRFRLERACVAAYGRKVEEKLNKSYHKVEQLFSSPNKTTEKEESIGNQFDVFGKM